MRIGLIGAGNMASALARGLGQPLLVHDPQRERAEALVAQLGGEVCASNRELAERAELVFLCCKPAQLEAVAPELRGVARAVASVLAMTPLDRLEQAIGPPTALYRLMPNLPVAVGRGVIGYVPGPRAEEGPAQQLLALLARAGRVVEIEEQQLDALMALASCGPAFVARFLDELARAGARLGLAPELAGELAMATVGGTVAYLEQTGLTPSELERQVATPGGATERGLAELDRLGLQEAVAAALARAAGVGVESR